MSKKKKKKNVNNQAKKPVANKVETSKAEVQKPEVTKTEAPKAEAKKPETKAESNLKDLQKKDADYKAVKREFDAKEKADKDSDKKLDLVSILAVVAVVALLVAGGAYAINARGNSSSVEPKTASPLNPESEPEPIFTACFDAAGEHLCYDVYEGDDVSAQGVRTKLQSMEKSGKDAEIIFNKDADKYEITPEELDVNINYGNISNLLKKGMNSGETKVDHTKTPRTIYTTVVTSADLEGQCEAMNDDYKLGTITYAWDGVSEEETREFLTVTGSLKKEWALPEGGYDEDKVADWIAGVAERYDTWKKPKKFITHDEREVTLELSSYGWEIDQQESLKELLSLLPETDDKSTDFVYSHEAYSHANGCDYGNTFVEVDILGQHVYYYKDGELKMDSDCVTGDAHLKRDTDPGCWAIFYMQRNRTLIGPGYATFVNYWMNFNHGEGLHDAYWRKADTFGGETYLRNGSHGCVNLPKDWAAQMYEEAYVGLPVIVYNE